MMAGLRVSARVGNPDASDPPGTACAKAELPWTAVAAALRAARPARGRYAMLYDGGCGTCGRTAAIVRRLDVLGRVDVLDAANDWAVVERRHRGLSQTACLEDMHVLAPDGSTTRGFDAYRTLGWALPIAWPLVPLLYVPGVRRIGQILYRVVANRRSHQCVLADRPSAPASGHESRGRDTSLLEP
jgi:predicted DCC family thiol-disulfide oxidoreductase YuxK